MRGRGEPELPVGLESPQLAQQVQAQAAGEAGRRLERGPPREDEAEPRHALDALVGRRDQVIDRRRLEVDRDRAEAAHRIDDEAPPVPPDHPADGLERVEDPRRRLAVDQRDVGDRRVSRQDGVHLVRPGHRVLLAAEDVMVDLQAGRHLRDPLAVRTIGEDQELAARRDHRGDHRLHAEGAAPLHQDRDMAASRAEAGQPQQFVADPAHDGVELGMPRAHVAEHRLLDGQARGQRAGRE